MTHRLTVLLVDDDPACTRRLMRKFHEDTCVAAVIAETLEQAAEYLDDRRLHLDALVTDICIVAGAQDASRGLFDGLELAAYAKRKRPGLPIYVVSVYADEQSEIARAARMGVEVSGWYQKLNDGRGDAPVWQRIETNLLRTYIAEPSPPAVMEYDLFLAHNSHDKALVEEFAKRLESAGVRPWFDLWHMPAGKMFQEELEKVIAASKAVAVIVGSAGLGPWEIMEMRIAISSFVRRRAPVIPTLLPNTNEIPALPLFLQEFSWVSFVSGWDNEREMGRILNAVQ